MAKKVCILEEGSMAKQAWIAFLIASAVIAGLGAWVWWSRAALVVHPDEARLQEIKTSVAALRENFENRLARIESRLERLAASAPGAAAEPGRRAIPGEDRSQGGSEAAEARLNELEFRLEALELQFNALEKDPINRAFEFLAAPSEELRRAGLKMLRRVARSDPQAREVIRKLLEDPHPRLRKEALEILRDVQDRDSIPAILALVADADAEVRRQAIEALGDIKAPEAIPALIKGLSDPDEQARGKAIAALGRFKDPAAAQPLRSLYDQGAGGQALPVALALKNLGDDQPFREEAKRLSQAALASPDEKARREAVKVLVKHAPEAYREVFMQALNDPSPRVREEAEKALGGEKKQK